MYLDFALSATSTSGPTAQDTGLGIHIIFVDSLTQNSLMTPLTTVMLTNSSEFSGTFDSSLKNVYILYYDINI